jgi:signal transduction histidine kinase
MLNLDSKLFCRLDGLSYATREQQRSQAIAQLGLTEIGSIPVFEELTQTAAYFLDAPVCMLSVMMRDEQQLKSAVGLSRLGLMNELSTTRQLPRLESFCAHVVDSHQSLAIADTLAHPAFAHSNLLHQYGIRAYLGVPLIAQGQCIGTLCVMDQQPREFQARDVEFLSMVARLSMADYERQHAAQQSNLQKAPQRPSTPTESETNLATQLKIHLLAQMTQELRTPLTSVMGMASMLGREIYGPLTGKQKEYVNIIHSGGQYLLSLVNEILELSELEDKQAGLNLASVDIEMLCQQTMNSLEQATQRREQQMRLTVEPGRRVWLLDKDKVRQMLYHLMFSIIQVSTAGSTLRIHISRKGQNLNMALWTTHPWLGEGLSQMDLYPTPTLVPVHGSAINDLDASYYQAEFGTETDDSIVVSPKAPMPAQQVRSSYSELGVRLCEQIARLHGGQFSASQTESGARYVISLPQVMPMN